MVSLLQNLDLDGFELTASVVSPGGLNVSSEKVDEGQLSSIDGYSSNSTDFDMAVAFDGDSDIIKFDLRVRCSPVTKGRVSHSLQ